MSLAFASVDLDLEFDSGTLDRGRRYAVAGKVVQIETTNEGTGITARVKGSRPKPYDQTIAITQGKRGAKISGYCSCPMAKNCKHVAAVLVAMLMKSGGRVAAPMPSKQPKPGLDRAEINAQARALVAAFKHGVAGFNHDDFEDDLDDDETDDFEIADDVSTPEALAKPSLSPSVSRWLETLGQPAPGPKLLPPSKQPELRRLLYLLAPATASGAGRGATVRLMNVRFRKDGTPTADMRAVEAEQAIRSYPSIARYIAPADIDIIRDLVWLMRINNAYGDQHVTLDGSVTGSRALAAMLATGRARWMTFDGAALTEGPVRSARVAWQTVEGGKQRVVVIPVTKPQTIASDDAAAPLPFASIMPFLPPRYFDAATGEIGPLDTGLPDAIAAALAVAPAIAASEAAIAREMMRVKFRDAMPSPTPPAVPNDDDTLDVRVDVDKSLLEMPLPEAHDNVEMREVAPVPRLELAQAPARIKSQYAYYASPARQQELKSIPIARLSFVYGDETIAASDTRATIETVRDDGMLVLMPRALGAEAAARKHLANLNFDDLRRLPVAISLSADDGALFLYPSKTASSYELLEQLDDKMRFIEFSMERVPELIADGWQVTFADDYPYRIAEGEAEWFAEVGEGSGIEWFSFGLGIEHQGQKINLVPMLAGLLEKLPGHLLDGLAADASEAAFAKTCAGLRLYYPLPDGRLLPIPGARLAPILKAFIGLTGPGREFTEDGKLKLHRAAAAGLAAFTDTGLAWAGDKRVIELGKRLAALKDMPRIMPPKTFKAKLRDYQLDGLSWLAFLGEMGFGGVLADDMGLGKTVQALAYLLHEKKAGRLDGPALIVAPTSVLPNWQAEAERFAPSLRVLCLRGPDRAQLFGDIGKNDLILTTYPLLARDEATLTKVPFTKIILDEAQAIKNPKSIVSGVVHGMQASQRIALSGTPLENNLGEIWSLFQFLNPGLLGDETTFRRTLRTPIEKHGDMKAQAFLARRLKPFMLRRTKAEVAKELPPKTEIIEHVRLDGAQRDLYETVRVLMHKRVRDAINKKGLNRSTIEFLDALLKLRQVCCDPRLLKMDAAKKVKGSAKLERLMEMLPQMIGEGRRVLLFSQFTSMLALIEDELEKLNIPYVTITGDTVDRATPVREFQAGKVPLFLLSLKAGGTGLNLTAADTVIHYDPWWNPAVENQATDRAYRIGQDKPVFVHKMIADEGIEVAIEQLKAKKAQLAAALFATDGSAPLDLTEADVQALFAPLGGAEKRMKKAA